MKYLFGGIMNFNDILNGAFLLTMTLSAENLIDMAILPYYALTGLGVMFVIDGLTDSSPQDIKQIEKRLQKMEKKSNTIVGSINSNSDELSGLRAMVIETRKILGYKYRMFIEICIIQFENLTREWQGHYMQSEEFSSLFDKASKNSGLLTHEEKMKFAQWMNKALESLDENKIRKFAYSEDFRLYEEIIELYND